ncbi:hypothetical protein QKW34_14565 [Bacillus licheniformis]|nr:hypothetical protein QKW34_14565 [Bacillus licheniformis]
MKFSKIGALLLTLACLLLPFSSATAAGAGVWDNIGTYGMTSQTPIIKSSGGKFYFHNNSFYGFTFTLYEVDGAGSTPEIARKISTSDRKATVRRSMSAVLQMVRINKQNSSCLKGMIHISPLLVMIEFPINSKPAVYSRRVFLIKFPPYTYRHKKVPI